MANYYQLAFLRKNDRDLIKNEVYLYKDIERAKELAHNYLACDGVTQAYVIEWMDTGNELIYCKYVYIIEKRKKEVFVRLDITETLI